MLKPPYTNGIMDNPPCSKEDLQAIIESFIPSDEIPVADTFYIVSTWNRGNPETPINGDTAEFILSN